MHQMKGIHLSEDPQAGLEEIIDPNLDHVYPEEEMNKVSDLSCMAMHACLVRRREEKVVLIHKIDSS